MEYEESKLLQQGGSDDVSCKVQEWTIVDPWAELDHMYILEEDKRTVRKYDHEKLKGGKWILFFETHHMYSMWKKSCILYRKGELEGIKSLKASTGKKNPRSSTIKTGVIIFHCGPCDDERLMLWYGMNLVHLLRYVNVGGSIPYKSDEQSALGTRAMGVSVNSLYKLPVALNRGQYTSLGPQSPYRSNAPLSHEDMNWRWRSGDCRTDSNSWRKKDIPDDQSQNLPSSRLDVPWLNEPEDFFKIANNNKPENCGYWMMFVPVEQLDEAWKKALELFRKGDLPDDVLCVQATTQLQNYKCKNGILKFFVEKSEDTHYLEGVGRSLVQLMNYSCERGYMPYRSGGETICSVNVKKVSTSYTSTNMVTFYYSSF